MELGLRGWRGYVWAMDVLGVDLVFFEAGGEFLGRGLLLGSASRPSARR